MNEMIVLNEEQQYELLKKQAGALFKSGMFSDLNSYERAVAKILMGKELGVGAIASLKGIYLTKEGQVEFKGSLIAGIISNHPRFDYFLRTLNKEICEIEFFDSKFGAYPKDPVGIASFTMEEAKQAGLLNKDPKYNPWVKYPLDMLFNRALSRGARRFCAGAFNGVPVYVVGETSKDPIYPEKNILNETTTKITESILPIDADIIEEIKETHVLSEEFR